ncbi:MAG: T9SS type A sorting domain-containing protein [Bacteroidia bacterium]
MSIQAANFYGLNGSYAPALTPTNIGKYAWNGYYNECDYVFPAPWNNPPTITGAYCYNTNDVLAIVNASTSNAFSQTENETSSFQNSLTLINFLGSDNQCPNCSGTQYFGRNIFYSGILETLYPGQYDPTAWDFCDAQDMINSAPWDGPWYHSNTDLASNGWASDRRFIDATGNGGGSEGNFNGLDYMLLYNLYCIMTEQTSSSFPPITSYTIATNSYFNNVPSLPQIPQEYPFSNTTVTTVTNGTYSNPWLVSTSYCDQEIYIDQLNVGPNGGLILNSGPDSYTELNPSPGIGIIINGYCDIKPNSSCCINNTVQYTNEYSNFQTLAPYKKTIEFDTAFAYDGISTYPNPFSDNTTISFSIKDDGNVSIYMTDLTGKRISDLIKNDSYKKGSHLIYYNGANLAAGNYLCVLETKNSRQTFKMIKIQ